MMIIGTAKIEHHPENGCSPHVVILSFEGKRLWMAYRSREEAEDRLDDLAFTAPSQWGQELQVMRP